MPEGLKIQIGAEIGAAVAGIKQVEKQVSHLGDTIETLRAKALARGQFLLVEKDITKVAILNKEIQALEAEILRVQNIGRAGFNALGQAAVVNTNAITTGATKAFTALRSMAYVLPGIGIAGILGFATSFIGELFGIGQEASETAKKLKELIKPIDDLRSAAAEGVQGDISKIQALTSVVLDQTKSYTARNNALDQLKEINKSYFGDLSLEASSLALLSQRVNEYTQAIIQNAIIKAFSDQIGKLAVELANQNKELKKSIDEVNTYKEKLVLLKKQEPERRTEEFARAEIGLNIAIANANSKLADQTKVVEKLRAGFDGLNKEIFEAVQQSTGFRPLTTGGKPDNKDAERLAEELRKFNELRAQLFKGTRATVELDLEFKTDEQKSIDNLILQINHLRDKLPKIALTLQPMGFNATAIKKAIQKDFEDAKKEAERQVRQLNQIIENGLVNGISLAAEGIGKAIAGGGIKDIFQGLFQGLGEAMQSFGKALIANAIAIIALKKVLSNPAVAIAAGVALIAAGAAIKASISKIQGFQHGGLVFGPTIAMVGEGGGTSASNPEVIAPLDKLKNLIGGIGQRDIRVFVEGKTRGREIILVNSREQRSQRRLTGR